MDILLISPDHGTRESNVPWGVLALGSYLTNIKKRKVKFLDASLLSKSELAQELDHLLPSVRLVGIGCFTTDINYVKGLVDNIKERNPEVKIILGGPHVVLEPEQTCDYHNVDFVAYTDGELTVDGLVEELAKESPDFKNIPGLIFKSDGELIRTGWPEFAGFYDINYDLLAQEARDSFGNLVQVLTGRGCSFRCRFCYNSVVRQKFKPRPIEEIIAELEKLVEEYDPEVIYFRDDNFFQIKQRVYDFVRLYKEKKFKFRWRATCRASYFRSNYINAELIRQLGEINCETLKIGVESGSQRVLDYLKKGITIDNIKRAVLEISKSKSIKGNYSFIIGLPTQTVAEYIDTFEIIKFILKHEPCADIIGPQYFRVYPGGSLYDEIVEKYEHIKPTSFEDWAEKTDSKDDTLGLYRNAEYPWIPPEGKDLAMTASLLILFYRKPLSDFFRINRIAALPFSILAKFRVKHSMYKCLYDIKLFLKLYDFYRYFSPSARPLSA